MMDKQTWLDVKQQQIELYRKRATFHDRKKGALTLLYSLGGICAVLMPLIMVSIEQYLLALSFLILIPVSFLIWKLSTHENRSSQLLRQLATAVANEIRPLDFANKRDKPLDVVKKNVTTIETRFLSNDDELFVKKSGMEKLYGMEKR